MADATQIDPVVHFGPGAGFVGMMQVITASLAMGILSSREAVYSEVGLDV